jgi:hypothetical protein
LRIVADLLPKEFEIGITASPESFESIEQIAARILGAGGDLDEALAFADEMKAALIQAAAARARPVKDYNDQ